MKVINIGVQDYVLALPNGYLHLLPGQPVEVSEEIGKIVVGKKSDWFDIKLFDGKPQPIAEAQAPAEEEKPQARRPGRPKSK